ncbi:MAG TPA: protein kinase, partial [Ktedonobacterales bacterium]|nr:protein kinase [Ktedonobacterales bacterium]
PIIFRDLKPANIMVTADDHIKLIDFGIARVFSPNRTRDTQALGTPGYAPPEQYGKAQTDARADIYALGCTLYQMLSGYDTSRTPFALPPLHTRNPLVSPHIQLAIEKATRLDRDQRFRTMRDFKEALTHPDALYFLPGEPARSLTDVITLAKKYPQEGQRLLYAGHITGWLTGWGRRDTRAAQAALAAQAAIRAHPNDRVAGLASFLVAAQGGSPGASASRQIPRQPVNQPVAGAAGRSNATVGAGRNAGNGTTGTGINVRLGHNGQFPGIVINTPVGQFPVGPNLGGGNPITLQRSTTAQRAPQPGQATQQRAAAATATATGGLIKVQPGSIDFGRITHGQRAEKSFSVTGQTGARVSGTIAIDPPAPWLTVDHVSYNGASTLVNVTAETSKLSKAGREVGIIEVRSSGSQQTVSVPVFIEVVAAPAPQGRGQRQATAGTAGRAQPQPRQGRLTGLAGALGAMRRNVAGGQGGQAGQGATATTIRRRAGVQIAPVTLRNSFGWPFWLSLLLPFIVVEIGLLLMERLIDPRILTALPWHAPAGLLA